jgi:IS30 family transposase
MKKAGKITRRERFDIRDMLDLAWSYRKIATHLNRSPNSICQEVTNNSTSGYYDPIKADAKARARRRGTRLKWRKIEDDPAMRKYVVAGLKKHWNPDEIA